MPKKSLLGHYAQIRRPHCFLKCTTRAIWNFDGQKTKTKKYPHLSQKPNSSL